MNVAPTALPGVMIVEPRLFEDRRGLFFESYHAERYARAGLPELFVQENHSRSIPGTVRGLHYQLRHPQGKLIRVVRGMIWDVAVDIRRGSPTFRGWISVELSADNRRQLYIPPGFAHGFCVPEEESEVVYMCTAFYLPEDERGILWNDSVLNITWPVSHPVLSPKDQAFPELSAAELPPYHGGPA